MAPPSIATIQRAIDLGVLNGEHFTVMAGTGFDARMIRDADSGLKDRIGRAMIEQMVARYPHAEVACVASKVAPGGKASTWSW